MTALLPLALRCQAAQQHRPTFGFMGSLHLLRTRTETMNLAGQRVSPVSSSLGARKCWTGGAPILPRRFMGKGQQC